MIRELVEYGDLPTDVVRGVQRSLSSWFPASTHPGGFAWEVATGQLPERIALATTPDGVTGWAACSEHDARVECAPGDVATTRQLASWLLGTAGASSVSVAVHRSQSQLRDILVGDGFVEEAVPLAGVSHPAGDTGSRPPAGYRVRPLDEAEESLRLEAHRRAWKPANLPFTDGTAGSIDQSAESRLDADKFAAMRGFWLYERELDLVVEAPDGSFAGSCTVWLDPLSGWAELEPLGIVPEHRRQGLSQALALEVCRRVAAHGGHSVFINSAPLPYYRAPWDAYLKAGFVPMSRGTRMRRPGLPGER